MCFSMQSMNKMLFRNKGTEKDSLKCFILFYIHTHIRKIGPTSFVRDRRAPVCAGHMTRIIESHPPYLKNRRGPRRSSLTGEIGVRR